MPSLISSLFASVGAPVISAGHGETVVRYPLGVVADAENVAGVIVDFSEETGTGAFSVGPVPGDGTQQNDRHGRRVRVSGRLDVPTSTTVNARDEWLIDGVVYQTKRREAGDHSFATWRIVTVDESVAPFTQKPRVRDSGL